MSRKEQIDFKDIPFRGGLNSSVFYSKWLNTVLPARVTVTSCIVYKVIRDLESIYHVCINPIRRIGLIHK